MLHACEGIIHYLKKKIEVGLMIIMRSCAFAVVPIKYSTNGTEVIFQKSVRNERKRGSC